MKKNIVALFSILLLCGSCRYFEHNVPNEEDLLKQKLEEINWNEVDEFPAIAACDTVSSKLERRNCFFEMLTEAIQRKLSVDTLTLHYPQIDTIAVKVTVFPNSEITFEPQIVDSITKDTIKIDSIIRLRLDDFPKVSPAIKRGIPVKTQFILPVIIKVD